MARRSVNKAGAGIIGDMVAVKQGHGEGIESVKPGERMVNDELSQKIRFDVFQALISGHFRRFKYAFSKFIGQQISITHLCPVVFRCVRNAIKTIGNFMRE